MRPPMRAPRGRAAWWVRRPVVLLRDASLRALDRLQRPRVLGARPSPETAATAAGAAAARAMLDACANVSGVVPGELGPGTVGEITALRAAVSGLAVAAGRSPDEAGRLVDALDVGSPEQRRRRLLHLCGFYGARVTLEAYAS